MACYLTAVDKCYSRLCQKVEKLQDRSNSQQTNTSFSLADIDYCVMHVSQFESFLVDTHHSALFDAQPISYVLGATFAT